MAGTSLLALLDDIATVLDDVAAMTKVATKKTAGVLGDDLAVNAEQVSGVRAERELPVVWAVARSSLINKAILVPAALALSALAPWAVTPLLMAGGLYLCFEGVEKVVHALQRNSEGARAERARVSSAFADPHVDMLAFERNKIRGAARTDFILSAEIIAITLGVVAAAPLATRAAVLTGVALLITVGVYGLVAGIVKLDDAGLALSRRRGEGVWVRGLRVLGRALVTGAPWLMKTLAVVGTAAMLLVGGGILLHGVPALASAVDAWVETASSSALQTLLGVTAEAVMGLLAGALVWAGVAGVRRVRALA